MQVLREIFASRNGVNIDIKNFFCTNQFLNTCFFISLTKCYCKNVFVTIGMATWLHPAI